MKDSVPSTKPATAATGTDQATLCGRHLRFGWWGLAVFLTLGIILESLHGFKVGWYLNVSNETRRLMLTLGHAHGTLLALVNLGFCLTLPLIPFWEPRKRRFASACLLSSSVLMPAGFILGGLSIHAGDPGLGIFLLPPGALLLLVAVFLTARALKQTGAGMAGGPSKR
jgi:hypothetical protein